MVGASARGAARRDQVQVGQGGFVEHHGIGRGSEADPADVRGLAAEIAGDVVEQSAGRPGGGGVVLAAEAGERLHPEMAAQAVLGSGGIEDPVLPRGQGERAHGIQAGAKALVGMEGFGQDDFGGR